jgi:acetyl esterase/lipase
MNHRRMGRTPRWITGKLAQDTGARCLAVQYGLSPQKPFPVALTQGLAAYISLLGSAVDTTQGSVTATDICFAGDSAGGNIAIALLQLILEINRINGHLTWNGTQRDIPLPAGVAVLSPYVDLTRALDSEEGNLGYDIIPARGPPFANFDRCDVWPARPPRHHVYADDSALLHPLVSPVTATDWTGAPPVWICVGEECLADQGMLVAHRMARAGARVVVEQYPAMPHNFSLVVPDEKASQDSVAHWASFIQAVICAPLSITTEVVRWAGRPFTKESLEVGKFVPVTAEELKKKMKAQIVQWGPPPA